MSDVNATCRSCGAPIYWVRLPSGKLNPVDREPVPNGNMVLTQNKVTGYLTAAWFREDEHEGRNRFVSHFATCPESKNWRRER